MTAAPVGAVGTSLGRASALGALGTAASRLTGFLRTLTVAAAVGATGFADSYNIANTTPNIVYDLLLGGVLSSVVVPVLVRAHREDPDGGTAFSQALLSVVAVGLGLVALVAVLAAPQVVDVYLPAGVTAPDRAKAVLFARFFLPQLLFYGLTATAGAVLNTRDRFGRDTVAPVLNNLVVMVTAVVFVLLPGPRPPTSSLVTTAQTLTLAVGTTAGVALMALSLLPPLRAAGVPWRWRLDLRHDGLAEAARLAGWVALSVLVSQAGFVVVSRLAAGYRGGFSLYSYAYQLFQLPYAVVGVAVLSALLPRMSRAAAAGRPDLLRADVSRGVRLALTLVLPASLALAALAGPLARVTFQGASGDSAARIGDVLAVFALALVPFTLQQMLLRAFYAQSDSRTAALLTCGVTAVLVGVDLAVAAGTTGPGRVRGLAGGFAAAYTVGAVASALVLRARVGGRGRRVLRLAVRVTLAGLLGAGVAWLLATGAVAAVGGVPGAALGLVLAAAGGVPAYLLAARRMRVRELDPLLATVGRRLNPAGRRAD